MGLAMGSVRKRLDEFQLVDQIKVHPFIMSRRRFQVYANDKRSADITCRIHHSLILREQGLL